MNRVGRWFCDSLGSGLVWIGLALMSHEKFLEVVGGLSDLWTGKDREKWERRKQAA